MAQGDYAPGTKIRPGLINIRLKDGQLEHFGIAYQIVLPSGRVLTEHAYTWHNEAEGRTIDPDHIEALNRALAACLADLIAEEGVDGLADPEPPQWWSLGGALPS